MTCLTIKENLELIPEQPAYFSESNKLDVVKAGISSCLKNNTDSRRLESAAKLVARPSVLAPILSDILHDEERLKALASQTYALKGERDTGEPTHGLTQIWLARSGGDVYSSEWELCLNVWNVGKSAVDRAIYAASYYDAEHSHVRDFGSAVLTGAIVDTPLIFFPGKEPPGFATQPYGAFYGPSYTDPVLSPTGEPLIVRGYAHPQRRIAAGETHRMSMHSAHQTFAPDEFTATVNVRSKRLHPRGTFYAKVDRAIPVREHWEEAGADTLKEILGKICSSYAEQGYHNCRRH